MKSIYKYIVEPQSVLILKTDKILSAIKQNNNIVVYATYDDTLPERKFEVIGIPTGDIIEIDLSIYTFLNTVDLNGLVFHIFYRKL